MSLKTYAEALQKSARANDEQQSYIFHDEAILLAWKCDFSRFLSLKTQNTLQNWIVDAHADFYGHEIHLLTSEVALENM